MQGAAVKALELANESHGRSHRAEARGLDVTGWGAVSSMYRLVFVYAAIDSWNGLTKHEAREPIAL